MAVQATPGTGVSFKTSTDGADQVGHVNVDSIAAGDNNIGNVDVASVPTDPFGANADAASVTGSISAKLRAMATAIGTAVFTRNAGAADAGTLRVTIDSGQVGTLGQAASAASIPVVVANDQSAVPTAHNTTGIGHGVTTVTTAGTDVALAASTAAKWVTIQAQTDNTGVIAVGATGVDATVATGTGVALAAGESITILCDNLADIFIDSTVNGEGVRYTYGT